MKKYSASSPPPPPPPIHVTLGGGVDACDKGGGDEQVEVKRSRLKPVVKRRRSRNRLRKSIPLSNEKATCTRVFNEVSFLSQDEVALVIAAIEYLDLPSYTSNVDEDIDYKGNAVHCTTYISGVVFQLLPWLKKRVFDLVRRVNRSQGWGFDTSSQASSSFNIRVAEYHEMFENGSLSDIKHFDVGSLITVDIMLEESQKGARFRTIDRVLHRSPAGNSSSRGSRRSTKLVLRKHDFHKGDALVFVSHKHHSVSRLVKGSRKVLIFEFWHGMERHCGHRCDCPFGVCDFISE